LKDLASINRVFLKPANILFSKDLSSAGHFLFFTVIVNKDALTRNGFFCAEEIRTVKTIYNPEVRIRKKKFYITIILERLLNKV